MVTNGREFQKLKVLAARLKLTPPPQSGENSR